MTEKSKVPKRGQRKFLIYYLEHSSLHCVWHLSRFRRNHLIETIFWSLTIITFMGLASSTATVFWKRYLYNPTVVTIDRDYLNRNITFPPITLCLRNKLNETAVEELLTEYGFNESQREDPKLMRFMRSLAHFTINSLEDLLDDDDENYFDVDDYIDIMMKISNKLPQNISISSTDKTFFFSPILTDELGLCYTFNSRISSYLSPTFLILGNSANKSKAKLLEEINYYDGDATAVAADLTNNVDIYYHGPNELPSTLRRVANEDPKQKSYISLVLVPVMIKSQERTRQLFEFQRKCKFEEESTLTYFPQIYTQDLCRMDCRMRKYLEICDCLPFFYKRKDSDTKCDIKGLKCIADIKESVDETGTNDCSCLKDCNDIRYSVQASNTMFWFHNSRVSWTMMQTKMIYKRELIHGFIEAMVSTGANFSLFVGMSSLTFVEIFFFVFLRIKIRISKLARRIRNLIK